MANDNQKHECPYGDIDCDHGETCERCETDESYTDTRTRPAVWDGKSAGGGFFMRGE